jgi:hypothetical protein
MRGEWAAAAIAVGCIVIDDGGAPIAAAHEIGKRESQDPDPSAMVRFRSSSLTSVRAPSQGFRNPLKRHWADRQLGPRQLETHPPLPVENAPADH